MRKNMLRAVSGDVIGFVNYWTANDSDTEISATIADIEAGDVLVVVVAAVATDGTWTLSGLPSPASVESRVGTDIEMWVFVDTAAGGETSVGTVGMNPTGLAYMTVMQCRGHDEASLASAIANGASATADPPLVTYATGDLVLAMTVNADQALSESAPSDYISINPYASGALHGTNSYRTTGMTGPSEDPGTVTLFASDEWIAVTMALPLT